MPKLFVNDSISRIRAFNFYQKVDEFKERRFDVVLADLEFAPAPFPCKRLKSISAFSLAISLALFLRSVPSVIFVLFVIYSIRLIWSFLFSTFLSNLITLLVLLLHLILL